MDALPKLIKQGSEFQIWSIGVVIIIGGNFIMWNAALTAGLFGFITLTLLVSTGFICLVMCISEILSGLPFGGGAFCMARCTIGLVPGYLTGCGEVCYYVISTAFTFNSLAMMITDNFHLSKGCAPVFWFCFYAFSFAIQTHTKTLTFFWVFTELLAVISIIILLVYSFGTFSSVSSSDHNINKIPSGINFSTTLQSFQSITWFFTGIECLSFVCNMISTPKKVIARSFLVTLATVFSVTFLVIISTLKLNSDFDTLATDAFPLNNGFVSFLGCTSEQATFLSIPGTFATGYGFMFAYTKLIHSLAMSGLLPEFLGYTTAADSPYNAAIWGSLASFAACALIEFVPTLALPLSNLCFLAAYITYCVYCLSYIRLQQKFGKSITFAFKSPLGQFGAVYGIFIFTIGIVSICAFQNDKGMAVILLVALWVGSSIYYFAISKNRQKFSKEEQKAIFLGKVAINPSTKPLNLIAVEKNKWLLLGALKRNKRLLFRAHTIFVAEKKDNYATQFEQAPSKESSHVTIQKSLCVREQLEDKAEALVLRQKASKVYCEESVDFCMDVIAYRMTVENILTQGLLYSNLTSMHGAFLQIVVKYIESKSPCEVNISSQQKTKILKFVTLEAFSSMHPLEIATIFDGAFSEIEKMLGDNIRMRSC